MRSAIQVLTTFATGVLLVVVSSASAQDWPQWRGPNRDGKAPAFKAPATWPAALTKKWDKPIGDGDAGSSLVGDRLYVFARQGTDEIIQALNAQSGEPIWAMKYSATPQLTGDSGHAGPRCPPTVADGKIVTYGCDGMLTCWNAADGTQLWQKNEFVGKSPQFHTSSAPIVVDGMCVAQLGGARNAGGAMVAYDLTSGAEKWRVTEGSGSYASPVLMSVGGTKVIIGPSESTLVAVSTTGKLMWNLPYRQGRYNAATPIVQDDMLIIAGPENGISILKLTKEGDKLTEKEVSTTKYVENSVLYNTPVLKDGMLFGLSTSEQLFCVVELTSAQPKTAWTAAPLNRPAGVGQLAPASQNVFAQQEGERRGPGEGRGGQGGGQPGRGQRRGRGGGGGSGGYGSVIDAGSVLIATNPAGELVVFKPTKDAFSEVARYKVTDDGNMYAHPIVSGNRIFTKDRDSVTLWTVD